MKLQMYCMYDSAAETYSPPMFARAHGEAMRDFTQGVNDTNPQNLVSRSPDDYTLYHIGEYETDTAKITTNETPIQILRGKDAKIRNENQK